MTSPLPSPFKWPFSSWTPVSQLPQFSFSAIPKENLWTKVALAQVCLWYYALPVTQSFQNIEGNSNCWRWPVKITH